MEFQTEAQLKAHLIQTDPSFRALCEQHHEYDVKLQDLENRSHLSADEEMEEHRLKKLKLQAKDQMRDIMSRHQTQ